LGGYLVSKLDYLEVNRNFRSYYRTLRDINYYLNQADGNNEKLINASEIITKLIFNFIRTDGTTFREMDQDQYTQQYQMFSDDLVRIIQTSGENNVNFDEFARLLDELLGIANHRVNALGKIKRTKQEPQEEENEAEEPVQTALVQTAVVQPAQEPQTSEPAPELSLNPLKDARREANTAVDPPSAPVNEQNVEADDEELEYESGDTFHFRPRRRRFR
jgi:hypothetical protein